jgi:hypothetical protein
VISIQICEHCGAVKDAEIPSEIVQTLKKIGWELKRTEAKQRSIAAAEARPAKKKTDSREESDSSTSSEAEEPVTAY